jgi:hypothetical protein
MSKSRVRSRLLLLLLEKEKSKVVTETRQNIGYATLERAQMVGRDLEGFGSAIRHPTVLLSNRFEGTP